MSDTLLGVTDEVLIARGRYATLRSEHRKHSRELQTAMVAEQDQGRLLLRFIDDSGNLLATMDAFTRRQREIEEHVAELLGLNEQLEALRPAAWGKEKQDD